MPLALVLLLLLLAAPAALAAPPDRPDGEIVRVRLFDRERPAQATVRPLDGPADLFADGRFVQTLPMGTPVALALQGGRVTASTGAGSLQAAVVTVRPHDPSARLRVAAGRHDRPYRGALEAAADGRTLRLVNEVVMEDYIASVVPSEYPFPELEGVKAQAVLVRTYALRSRGRFGTHDVVDHVGSQVYHGADAETPTARRAAYETRGEVLTYGGELIEAVYFSSSGGHTTNNEGVWDGPPRPYLRGRPDPYDAASPNFRWTESIERDRLLRILSRHYGFQVTDISIAATSPEGRATAIRLHGARARTEQANRFRLTVNELVGRQLLRSTFFTLSRQGNRYVFAGRGFGHGVGMSQYGAREQARLGRSYHEILAFYFTGATLEGGARLAARPLPGATSGAASGTVAGWTDIPWPDLPNAGADVTPPERIEPRPVRPVATGAAPRGRTGW